MLTLTMSCVDKGRRRLLEVQAMYGTTQFARPLRYVLRDAVLHKVRATNCGHLVECMRHIILIRYAEMVDGDFTLFYSTMPLCTAQRRFSRKINTSEQTRHTKLLLFQHENLLDAID